MTFRKRSTPATSFAGIEHGEIKVHLSKVLLHLNFHAIRVIIWSDGQVGLVVKERSSNVQVNVLEAKTDLSKLIRMLESGMEDTITVARNGKPVVKIVLIDQAPVSRRIGIAKGKFKAPDDFDAAGEEAAAMLTGGAL